MSRIDHHTQRQKLSAEAELRLDFEAATNFTGLLEWIAADMVNQVNNAQMSAQLEALYNNAIQAIGWVVDKRKEEKL